MVRCRVAASRNGSLQVAASRKWFAAGLQRVAASRNGSLQVAASRKWFAAGLQRAGNGSLQSCSEQKWFSAGCSEQEMVLCKVAASRNGSLQVAASRKCLYIFVYGVNHESKQIP